MSEKNNEFIDDVVLFLQEVKWKVNDYDLYYQALTHSSYAHEKGAGSSYNERLEFLGDAVLELIISDYLYKTYPEFPEGKMTKLRADLVCEATLVRLARNLNLSQYLRLGKGELRTGGANRPSLLADAVEALIGALYLDQGWEECCERVLQLFKTVLTEVKDGSLISDYKTLLQEFTQARFFLTPVYRIVRESGPDHDKMFLAEVLLEQSSLGKGKGRSKKEAEQEAAKAAWLNYKNGD